MNKKTANKSEEKDEFGFLPKDYTVPESGNYMKFKDGANTFRILSKAITGYEYWTEDNKSMRSHDYPVSTPGIRVDDEGKVEKPKHFWACVVWNHNAKRLQILQITQKAVQSGIKALIDNKQWGSPKKYDITVMRSGQGFDTQYTVMPNPHSELNADIIKVFEDTPIDLQALYSGADPFDPNWIAEDALPEDDE